MLFEYQAKTLEGYMIKGEIEALTERAAVDTLAERGLVLLSLKEAERRKRIGFLGRFFSRIKMQDILLFSRQLSVMVSAGLSLVRSLEALAEQSERQGLKSICLEMATEIRGGARLSSVMAKYPNIFDNFYLNMVRAGETSGKLDEVLSYLADEQEKNYALKSKIRGSMIYPIFVLVAVFVIGAVMMTFVIPKMLVVLVEAGVSLPLTTRILLAISNFLTHNWYFLLLVLTGLILFFRFLINTPAGRYIFDRLKLKIPIFGSLFRRIYLVRFARSMSTLIVGGVPIAPALKIVSDVVGNAIYKDLVLQAAKAVEGGESVAAAFLKTKEIPPMVSQMLLVGEQTGRLDVVLDKLANFYAREIENLLGKLAVLIEPLVIIILGIGIGLVVVGIILPMYNLAKAI